MVAMIDDKDYRHIVYALPLLRQAGRELTDEFRQAVSLVRLPAGSEVFGDGDTVNGIALLVSGVVRVYTIGANGREITLYRFGLGESCVLTASAILNSTTFPAIATVEQDAEAIMIPAEAFRRWVHDHDLWRRFAFEMLSRRLAGLMGILDEVAFRRMDARLASLLLARSHVRNPVQATHQQIAAELGSSREVISRLLEGFARDGLVRAGRGEVEVLDAAGLQSRAVV